MFGNGSSRIAALSFCSFLGRVRSSTKRNIIAYAHCMLHHYNAGGVCSNCWWEGERRIFLSPEESCGQTPRGICNGEEDTICVCNAISPSKMCSYVEVVRCGGGRALIFLLITTSPSNRHISIIIYVHLCFILFICFIVSQSRSKVHISLKYD